MMEEKKEHKIKEIAGGMASQQTVSVIIVQVCENNLLTIDPIEIKLGIYIYV
jgi:hypothetical protein